MTKINPSNPNAVSIKIAATQELIDMAEQRREDRSGLQKVADFLMGPSMPGSWRVDQAKGLLVNAKRFLAQGDLEAARKVENQAYRAIQVDHAEFGDYEVRSIEHGETLAKIVKNTGDGLFAIGCVGALVAAAAPAALGVAGSGSGGSLLGWGGTTLGAGSGLSLASVGKRWIQGFFGGDEAPLSESAMRRDFLQGANLGSMSFFAPFAAAAGMQWAGSASGSFNFKEILPTSLLFSVHGGAEAAAEGGGWREVALAAGLGFMMPLVFGGLEQALGPKAESATRSGKREALPPAAPAKVPEFLGNAVYTNLRHYEGLSPQVQFEAALKLFGAQGNEGMTGYALMSRLSETNPEVLRIPENLEALRATLKANTSSEASAESMLRNFLTPRSRLAPAPKSAAPSTPVSEPRVAPASGARARVARVADARTDNLKDLSQCRIFRMDHYSELPPQARFEKALELIGSGGKEGDIGAELLIHIRGRHPEILRTPENVRAMRAKLESLGEGKEGMGVLRTFLNQG